MKAGPWSTRLEGPFKTANATLFPSTHHEGRGPAENPWDVNLVGQPHSHNWGHYESHHLENWLVIAGPSHQC